MPDELQYEIKVLFGTKALTPPEFRLAGSLGKFFIETEFVRLGPIDTEEEAHRLLAVANQSVRKINL